MYMYMVCVTKDRSTGRRELILGYIEKWGLCVGINIGTPPSEQGCLILTIHNSKYEVSDSASENGTTRRTKRK
jgi:hypothetical protein